MRNLSGRRRSEASDVQINKPMPGVYPLGSLQSRAATRALLDAQANDSNGFRGIQLVVEHIGRTDVGVASTCIRKGNEIIQLGTDELAAMEPEERNKWVRTVPKDGRQYKFVLGGPPMLDDRRTVQPSEQNGQPPGVPYR
jgi:hypothetical protein